ncbi:MAG TPA: SusC/RagA family TonB-linked outer membrane protein, partial [Bacteroidia bacterium]|nr:SusC/RagA family TonB-linked outer membrane protein [Bacteroidia bacterium]
MIKKKTIGTLCLIACSIAYSIAQNVTITGKVRSNDDKQTIPGAIVQITGTTTGVQTDLDGHYSISVPPDTKSLTFSFMGYASQNVLINGRQTIDIALELDRKQLGEVVSVGYVVQNKKEVTGAIATIKGSAIRDLPVQSFDQGLAGKATGVNITMPNGVLNNPPVIRVRGYNSITSSSYPLIVLDGIPMSTGNLSTNSSSSNPLGDINPDDIESIDILKDASATAIYGSRAANGVMIITTKRGKEGKAKVSYNSWVGVTQAFNLPKLLNADQYMTIKNEAARNANLGELFFPSYNPDGKMIDTRWYDHTYRTGLAHNNSISIAGATQETSYYFSLGYTKQDGFIAENEFKRAAVRFNIDQKVTQHIKVGANMSYTKSYNLAPNTGSLPGEGFTIAGIGRLAIQSAPNVAAYDATNPTGYNITTGNALGSGANKVLFTNYNPLALVNLNHFSAEADHTLANIYGELQVVKGLTFRTAYLVDLNALEGISYLSNKHGDGFNVNGSVSNVNSKYTRTGWTNTLFYQKQLTEKHSISVLGGIEELFSKTDRWGGSRQNIADDFFQTYQGNYLTTNPPTGINFQEGNVFLSYFGRVTYDFSKKYFLTASLRRDGFSGLSKGNKFGNFGGGSIGWTVSQEDFYKNWKMSKYVNSFKVRASYGKVGNIGIPNYGSYNLYNSDLYGDVNTITFVQAGNPTLKWETSTKFDLGLEMNFLKDRLQFELGYFKNNINGLVLNSPQAPSKGIPGNGILQNVGSMYNKGVEISLTSANIDKKNFFWSSNINYSYIANNVTALAAGNADIIGTTSSLEKTNITRVGYSVGCIYAVKTMGVNPDNGRRIFVNKNGDWVQYNPVVAAGQSKWTFMDGAPAPAISGEDAVIIGNSIPKWFGGFNNTFTFKEVLDLTLGITFSGGNYIYNGTKAGLRDQRSWNNSEEVMNRWTYEGQKTDIPRVVYGDNISNGSAFPISENVEKGDFLKFKTLALGYKFKSELLSKYKIASLRLYVQVSNLYTLTKYTGSDPEISANGNSNITPGVDRNSVPQARTYTFGI